MTKNSKNTENTSQKSDKKTVGIFATCLVDFFRPQIGFACVKLLEQAGFTVQVPTAQSCCGQPAYNSGDKDGARQIAEILLDSFADYDFVIAASGSCIAMITQHIPSLFEDNKEQYQKALKLAEKSFEITDFLFRIARYKPEKLYDTAMEVTYHDSCSGLRELGIHSQPRRLLAQSGITVKEMEDSNACCGFGGAFCVKFSDISNKIVSDKCDNIRKSGADILLAGDLGCLLNMAGKLQKDGSKIKAYHVIEALAGQLDQDAIGE